MGRLGSVLGRLGSVLAASWAVLAASWRVLGASCGVLLRLGVVLGASWSVLERKTTSRKTCLSIGTGSASLFICGCTFRISAVFSTLATCKNIGTSPHLYAPLASLAALARSLRLYNGYLFYSCAVATCKNVKFFSVFLQFF